jgi:hypothetical protein
MTRITLIPTDLRTGLEKGDADNADLKNGEQSIPRINADDRGSEPEHLPLMNTEGTDGKTGEQTSPRINTDQTDQDGGLGKMLPQSAGG